MAAGREERGFFRGGEGEPPGTAPGAGRHGRHGGRGGDHKLVMNSSCTKNKELPALIWGESTGKRLVA